MTQLFDGRKGQTAGLRDGLIIIEQGQKIARNRQSSLLDALLHPRNPPLLNALLHPLNPPLLHPLRPSLGLGIEQKAFLVAQRASRYF
ncbi:hypothetical protein [Verminephrobacter aporrectodeae]|uniref:hypothetical protein n=1 Tax=Verminephrobacter aporrectodeae TaxID=1110389 RepID=UPI00223896E6|nr:hypothetical protein [Verminephrobacter aporrectodeae]